MADTEGSRRLRVFMAERRIEAKDMASRAGCSASAISNLRTGRRAPGRVLALALERLTGGVVPVSAWDEAAAASEAA